MGRERIIDSSCLHRFISGLLFILLFGLWMPKGVAAQASGWVWAAGSDTVGAAMSGSYGTLGVPSATNLPGGRSGALSWTDQQGQFWLMGGLGYDSGGNYGYLNDLWKFNVTTKQWTWIGGSSSVPEFLGVTGVYGNLGSSSSANIPGGRENAASWVDSSGNLWLFGGDGYDSTGTLGYLNDLWEFDVTKEQWAWMGGSDIVTSSSSENGQPGVYGTLGTPSTTNIPGGRQGASSWVDVGGELRPFRWAGLRCQRRANRAE